MRILTYLNSTIKQQPAMNITDTSREVNGTNPMMDSPRRIKVRPPCIFKRLLVLLSEIA